MSAFPVRNFVVFSVRKDRKGAAVWTTAGTAMQNGDGSINIFLDVLPIDGQLQLRDRDNVVLPGQPDKKGTT